MNQIPNIEEEKMIDKFFEDQNNIWKSETGLTIAQCKKEEKELLRATLHHQLQKAREEERERIKGLVMAKSAIFDLFQHSHIDGRDELNNLIAAIDHSELDQDKK